MRVLQSTRANAAIVTVGVTTPHHTTAPRGRFRRHPKAGTVVVTGVSDMTSRNLLFSIFELTVFQKRQYCRAGRRGGMRSSCRQRAGSPSTCTRPTRPPKSRPGT
jgi:hypothetical protein